MIDRATAAIAILLLCAGPAHAGIQLFEGSWVVKAFGNERTGGTGESEFYSAYRVPLGIQCNPAQPRCPFESTPTNGAGQFAPLGGHLSYALFCAPWADWLGMGTAVRPAKGATRTTGGKDRRLTPPLYRNPAFFTSRGSPNTTRCTAKTTDGMGGKGLVQAGNPITGMSVTATTTTRGAFSIPQAPLTGTQGIRATGIVGEFGVLYPYGEGGALYPYVYSYTYATLRNDVGVFGPRKGPGSFAIQYKQGQNVVASIKVKQGAAKFGGTMRMLGKLHTKVCYYRNGGCSLSYENWLYDWIGVAAETSMGVVTKGYQVWWTSSVCTIDEFSCPRAEASRFPWTTGSVTVTAVGRGPHKTVHYGMGYDNRTPTSGKGTIQLVSPTMTRWLLPGATWETGGIAILRIKFLPEPRAWAMLVAGMSALAVAYRWRSR